MIEKRSGKRKVRGFLRRGGEKEKKLVFIFLFSFRLQMEREKKTMRCKNTLSKSKQTTRQRGGRGVQVLVE